MSKINFIAVDVTYSCNMRCKHCYNSSGENSTDFLTDSELMEVANQIIEIKPPVLCICGGEPLLKYDLLLKFIKKIYDSLGTSIAINMVSNGQLLTREKAIRLKEVGLNALQISLDGGSKETYEWLRGVEGSFEKAIQAIKILSDLNYHTTVTCLPTKKTIEELPTFFDLCNNIGVKEVRFQPLMMLGRAIENLYDYELSDMEYAKFIKVAKRITMRNNYSFSIKWGDPLDHLLVEKTATELGALTITARGELLISPYLPISFGNVKNHTIVEYCQYGLCDAWNLSLVKEYVSKISKTADLDLHKIDSNIPKIFIDTNINIDLIDNKQCNER